jgi:hypothetical protein
VREKRDIASEDSKSVGRRVLSFFQHFASQIILERLLELLAKLNGTHASSSIPHVRKKQGRLLVATWKRRGRALQHHRPKFLFDERALLTNPNERIRGPLSSTYLAPTRLLSFFNLESSSTSNCCLQPELENGEEQGIRWLVGGADAGGSPAATGGGGGRWPSGLG